MSSSTPGEVLAERDERRLVVAVLAVLTHADGGGEPVAQALAALGVLDRTALLDEHVHRLARAAEAHGAVRPLVGLAQVGQVAQALARLVDLGLADRALQRDDLEREAGRAGPRVVAHGEVAGAQPVEREVAGGIREPGLLTQGEQRSDLHADRTRLDGRGHLAGGAVRTRHPERQADGGHLRQVGLVAGAVDRGAVLVELHPPARGRRVAAGRGALDDEAVGADLRVAVQVGGELVERDDGEEVGPGQRRQVGTEQAARVRLDEPVHGAAGHVDRDPADLARREGAQQLGHLARDAGAHQHVVDAAEHRAEQGGRGGQLDLLEAVDSDDAVVALLGEPDLGEVADHGELLAGPGGVQGELRQRLVRGLRTSATLDEVGVEHPLGHGRAREVGQGAAVVAALVAVLEAAGEHGVHRGSGHDAEVPGAGDLAGQPPAGDRDAHPTLDDRRTGPVRGTGRRGDGLGQDCGHGGTFVVREPTFA